MRRHFLSAVLITVGIVIITAAAILLAKGYRFDQRTGTLKGTGIIAVSTIPEGAAVYLDNELVSASNNTINNLDPNSYKLKVTKDGFSTWEKEVTVEAEKVSLVNVVLFPSTPDLRPLTFSGIINPQLSPDGQRIVYAQPDPAKAGLWVLDISNRPFTFSRDPRQIAKDTPAYSYSKSAFSWAPDSKTVLSTGIFKSGVTSQNVAYLLGSDQANDSPTNIIASLDQTKNTWQSDLNLRDKERLSLLSEDLQKTVSSSPNIRWSPDELKVAYESGNKIVIYDLKNKKSYEIAKTKEFSWYPDSLHLVLVEDGSVSIIDSDGWNKIQIYAGSFSSSVFAWPDGSKLVILASFNQNSGSNLYSINLR